MVYYSQLLSQAKKKVDFFSFLLFARGHFPESRGGEKSPLHFFFASAAIVFPPEKKKAKIGNKRRVLCVVTHTT